MLNRLDIINQDNNDNDKDEGANQLEQALLKRRTILLSGSVNSKMTEQVLKRILVLEDQDPQAGITVVINSPGGEIYSGFAILDMLQLAQCPITTLVSGLAASMGSVLALAADPGKSLITPHSKVMIHQPLLSGGMQAPTTDLEIHSEQILKTKKQIAELYAEKTGKKASRILKDMNRDFWLSAQEAIDYGLIDAMATSID